MVNRLSEPAELRTAQAKSGFDPAYVLLGFAIAVSPLTASRPGGGVGLEGGIGITDVVLILATLLVLASRIALGSISAGSSASKISLSPVSRFWYIGLPLLTVCSAISLAREKETVDVMFKQFVPYAVVGFCMFAVGTMRNRPKRLRAIYIGYLGTNAVISLAYILMILSGLPQFYFYDRFEGLSVNPNQTAMQAISCAVICYLYVNQYGATTIFSKIILPAVGVASLLYGVATKSDADKISTLVMLSATAGLWSVNWLVKQRLLAIAIVGIPAAILLFAFYLQLNNTDLGYVLSSHLREGGDQGDLRSVLWKNGLKAGFENPIFGQGAGAWSGEIAPFGENESHNALIDWFSMTGIVGVLLLLSCGFMAASRRAGLKWANLVGVVSMAPIAMFHSPLRHVDFWLALDLASVTFVSQGLSWKARQTQRLPYFRSGREPNALARRSGTA